MEHAGARHEQIEEAPSLLRSRCGAESCAGALLRVRGQRELRDEQKTSRDIAQAQVHAPFRVRKDAIPEDPLEQPLDGVFVVTALHADERENAALDRARNAAADAHFGLRDALDQGDHGPQHTRAHPHVPGGARRRPGWLLRGRIRKIRGRFWVGRSVEMRSWVRSGVSLAILASALAASVTLAQDSAAPAAAPAAAAAPAPAAGNAERGKA